MSIYLFNPTQYPSRTTRGIWALAGEQTSVLLTRELLEEVQTMGTASQCSRTTRCL